MRNRALPEATPVTVENLSVFSRQALAGLVVLAMQSSTPAQAARLQAALPGLEAAARVASARLAYGRARRRLALAQAMAAPITRRPAPTAQPHLPTAEAS